MHYLKYYLSGNIILDLEVLGKYQPQEAISLGTWEFSWETSSDVVHMHYYLFSPK